MGEARRRPHFSTDSNAFLNYYLYQPVCLMLEPLVVRHRIHPHAITGVRALTAVAVAVCIAASAIDAASPRRWAWVLLAWLFALFAGMTDDLDGFVARKYGLTSTWGKYADGTADVATWTITWLAMFYFFGWRRVWLPVALWLAIGAGVFFCLPSTPTKEKIKGFTMDGTLLPLLVALFYACYPPR